MVNQHFSMVDDSPESFRTIKLLQESTKSASKILNCSVCFDPTNATFGGLAKNVHLLGSLVSSIASLYATFMVYQKRRATETSKKNEPMKMFLGEDEASDALGLVPVTLSGQDYWNFLKAIMATEFARLQDIGDAFADRQTQLHSQGHEACEGGSPCTRTEICSPVSMPIDACPTKVDDIKSQFSCFRTVEQVRQSIAQAQMTLHS